MGYLFKEQSIRLSHHGQRFHELHRVPTQIWPMTKRSYRLAHSSEKKHADPGHFLSRLDQDTEGMVQLGYRRCSENSSGEPSNVKAIGRNGARRETSPETKSLQYAR